MIQQTFTLAIRVLIKNWLYTLLCVLSLFLGLLAFVSSLVYAERVRTLDEGLTHYDRLFEIHSVWFGSAYPFGTTPRTADIVRGRFPEIEQITRLIPLREVFVESQDQQQYVQFLAADPNFFELIDYTFSEGDPRTALDNPYSVILSQSAAEQYFGYGSVLGETIEVEGQFTFKVTGVVEDLPMTSNLFPLYGNLDFVSSIETFRSTGLPGTKFQEWGVGRALTIALLPPTLTEKDLRIGLESLVVDYWPEMYHDSLEIGFRHFGDLLSEVSSFGGFPLPTVILAMGIAVLLVGCANFASLFMAQNVGRTKEIALRKAMGSGRHLIVFQFLLEGFLVSLMSLGLALCVLPYLFGSINQGDESWWTITVLLQSRGLFWLLLLAPIITLVGGVYPALRFSTVYPYRAFREHHATASRNGLSRGAAVVVQFVLAVTLLIVSVVVWRQQAYVESLSTRYAQDQIIVIDRLGREDMHSRLPAFKRQLLRTEGVVAVAASNSTPGEGRFFNMKFRRSNDDLETDYWLTVASADPDFITVYDIDLIAGRRLSEDIAADLADRSEAADESFRLNVLINEHAVPYLGFSSPEAAIGQVVEPTNDGFYPYVIVGVVENANVRPYPFQRESTLFFGMESAFANMSIRISGADTQGVVRRIKDGWDNIYPEYPMEWKFLDEEFAATYSSRDNITNMLVFCCGLALMISALGMFGLAGYVAETRTKEIGVRKVMGADVGRITRLLLWDFSKPVMVANLIAWPLAYLATRSYLDRYADRIDLSPLFFIGAGLAALVIAWLVVAIHVFRAACTHPVHALRCE